MHRVADGDQHAFGALYDHFHGRVHRVARSVCHDDGNAQEAVQETFIAIWNSRTGYEPSRGSVIAWILTIAHNRAIDVSRRHRRHRDLRASDIELDGLHGPEDVAEEAVARNENHRMRDALSRLPDAQQEVITLAFYGQLSHREIALQLGLPPGTVKGRMRLGLQKLRWACS